VKYFIDANIIIDLLSNKEEAKKQIKALIEEEGSELFINRLISLETLRTIEFKKKKVFRESAEKLKLFRAVNITPEIYTKAIEFSRFCKSKGVQLKGKCATIDFLHFITAKHYNLEMIAKDNDFDKLEKAYLDFNAE